MKRNTRLNPPKVPVDLCHAVVAGNFAAKRLRDGIEERHAQLAGAVPATSTIHWRLASAGKPSPLPIGDHLFILRGSPFSCVAAFATFERSDPKWFENCVAAWAPLPPTPLTLKEPRDEEK